MTGRGARIAVAAVLVPLAGCTAGSAASTPMPARASTAPEGPQAAVATQPAATPPLIDSQMLVCGNAIDNDPPPRDWQVVHGVVALPTSPGAEALQTGLTGEPAPALRLFAKAGLVVKARVAFELLAPRLTGNRVGIGWGGGPSTPSRRFVVPNCPDTGGTGWLAYPGGYWVDHPACIPLTIRSGTTQEQVVVGLGTPCPRQRPPQGPSDR